MFRAKPSILDPFLTKFDVFGPDRNFGQPGFGLGLALDKPHCCWKAQPLSETSTSVLSQQQTSVLSQQQTSVLSQQQTSVLSQQKTSILSQQKTRQLPASGRLLLCQSLTSVGQAPMHGQVTMFKSQIGGLALNRRKWPEMGPESSPGPENQSPGMPQPFSRLWDRSRGQTASKPQSKPRPNRGPNRVWSVSTRKILKSRLVARNIPALGYAGRLFWRA